MIILYIVTAVALLVSTIASPGKTLTALKAGGRRFAKILPVFLVMLILLSVAMAFLLNDVITEWLGKNNGWLGVGVASVLGSVTLIPGFIAYPLCGALLSRGIPYMVLSAFTTTLMSVGVLTYPIERQYLGRGVTLVRNAICFLIALVVAVATGVAFGEIPL